MKKMSQEALMQTLQSKQNIDELINELLNASDSKVINDAAHDYILTEKFFPILGEEFETSPEVSEAKFEEFKKQFPYKDFGINEKEINKVQQMVEEGKSIDKVIDTIIEYIPDEKKDEIAHNYIKEVWFVQNCKSDMQTFITNVKPAYWLRSKEE